ncbi:MAG: tRNA (adenosine(37)-N6)-dimethylallyltransferase MiaA [bacterium]
MEKNHKPLLCILGPTAVGKTELALRIAQRINGEIVSVDSRQIYREMDIGTAKPTTEQLKLIPHHVINCIMPDEYFSAADYQRAADKAIQKIQEDGKVPMLVGGSGMYFRAVVDGLFQGPEADNEIRQCLRQQAKELGVSYLYDKLKNLDPKSAEKIHPNDLMRIIRAIEVYEKSGKRISELQQQWESEKPRYEFIAFGLDRPRNELYERINARVDQMIKDGLLDEARGLLKYDRNMISMNCFGYKELFDHLEGKISLDEAIRLIKQNTRRFAKRQLTWFRKDKRIIWINLSDCPFPDDLIIKGYLNRQS